jgi:stage II sporulation protein AB (anti-sigma F factor)
VIPRGNVEGCRRWLEPRRDRGCGVLGGRSETLALTLPSAPASSAVARRELERFLDGARVEVPTVVLAVTEAINNAILHGYRSAPDGLIEVSVERRPDEVTVVVVDRGLGMAPHPNSEGLGLGLPLIGAYADSVEVGVPDGGGTKMTMRFQRLGPR